MMFLATYQILPNHLHFWKNISKYLQQNKIPQNRVWWGPPQTSQSQQEQSSVWPLCRFSVTQGSHSRQWPPQSPSPGPRQSWGPREEEHSRRSSTHLAGLENTTGALLTPCCQLQHFLGTGVWECHCQAGHTPPSAQEPLWGLRVPLPSSYSDTSPVTATIKQSEWRQAWLCRSPTEPSLSSHWNRNVCSVMMLRNSKQETYCTVQLKLEELIKPIFIINKNSDIWFWTNMVNYAFSFAEPGVPWNGC